MQSCRTTWGREIRADDENRSLTFKELVQPRYDDDEDGQQLAEGEEVLNPGCPCDTHTVQIHDGSCKETEHRLINRVCEQKPFLLFIFFFSKVKGQPPRDCFSF